MFLQTPVSTEELVSTGSLFVPVKIKVAPVHAIKAHGGGSGDLVPLILNVGARWRWLVNFTPRPLCPRERILVPIEYEVMNVPDSVWMLLEKRQIFAPAGYRSTDLPARRIVSVLTTPVQLRSHTA
jgi:hypothetical protein